MSMKSKRGFYTSKIIIKNKGIRLMFINGEFKRFNGLALKVYISEHEYVDVNFIYKPNALQDVTTIIKDKWIINLRK